MTYSKANGKRMRLSRPNLVLATGDVVLVVFAFYIGVFSRWASFQDFLPSVTEHAFGAITFVSVIVATSFAVGLYSRDLEPRMSVVATRLLVALLFAFMVFSVIFYVLPDLIIWRSALAIAMILAFLSVMTWRYVWLQIVGLEAIKRRILTIGSGPQAAFIEELEAKSNYYPFRCVGYLHLHGEEATVPEHRILANNKPLSEIAAAHEVREIIVATEDWRDRLPISQLMQCRVEGVRIWDFLSFREHETGSVDLEAMRPSWFVFSGGFPGGPAQQAMKRAFDIVVAVVSFIFFLPLFCATALAIRLESPGSIFHVQERVGLGGKPFIAFKFRSMHENAEAEGAPKWAQEDDPRVTAVGKFIRRTRIDEIPQILNVLRGDMSFVGPRPERPYFVEQLAKEIPYYQERHRVKPGITGWAQLNYIYSASIEGAKEKLQYDLYYVKHYSLLLDLLIILQTVRVILWPKGVR